jgi:2-haloacid dehalogenase
MIRPEGFSHLTFDCYGTLIDWETGILTQLRAILERHAIRPADEEILELHSKHEALQEASSTRPYREILRNVMAGIASELGVDLSPPELESLPESIARWPAFADTVPALHRLKERYKLAILSNIDDDLFRGTANLLDVEFDDVITAQQVGAYKPEPAIFHAALERLGAHASRVLHVAQSLYHDHVPAKALGLTTVWINRPSLRADVGLAPPARASPDLEVPDMKSFVSALGL